MRIIVTAIFTWLLSFCSYAQLSSGTIAPDFVVTDINGNSHHLYDYLNQGYSVVLQFDATWNGPGWAYANSGALSSLYYEHGVDFGGNVIVLFLEADGTTPTDGLYGMGSISQGDWTSVVPFPIIDLVPTGAGYETQVGNDYNLTYYPTIYTICPNGTVTETGQITAEEHWSFIQNSQCQAVYNIDAYVHNYTGVNSTCGTVDLNFTLSNLGLNPLTSGQFNVTGVSPSISFNWDGLLNHFQSTQVNLGSVEVTGPVEISFSNAGEQNFSNNSFSPNILNPQFETSNLIQIELVTDCWPEEITWDITDNQGTVVYSSGIYGDGNYNTVDPAYDLVNLVLPALGCYTFNIYDTYGDGMNGSSFVGCSTDGMVYLNGLNANYNVTNTFYSIGGSQQFYIFSVPFTVSEISETTGNCDDVYISEYVEGFSNNKAIELYNPTSSPIDLGAGNYSMGRYLNGAGSPMLLPITGIIPPYGTRVFVLDKRDPNGTGLEAPVWTDLQALADTFVNPIYVQASSSFYFNGDDAFVLVKNGTIILDLIGKIGEDPGTGWYDINDPLMTPLTVDRTLVRKFNIGQGVTVSPSFFNPTDEWEVYPANDFSHLGWHESWCQGAENVGCTDFYACNYSQVATIDDGSCYYLGQACDDGNELTSNDVVNFDCLCSGVSNIASGCDPSSVDWSNETSIWLPDVAVGENLMEGLVNSPYSDNIYINTPTNLGFVDPNYTGLALNSLEITSIQVLWNGELYPLEFFGLSFQGNNGIETPSQNAIPGLPGCIEIYGVPNQPGVYPLVITTYFTTIYFGSEIGDFYVLNSYEIIVNENPYGCTNPLACNYNPIATIDNGDCLIVGAACDDNNANTFGDTINGSCECLGSAYNYGVLSLNDYVLCSENTQEVVLSFSSLPGGISQYTYQWYCRDGIQSAPSGNSTLGWTLVPGANSSMYSTAALESNKTFACFITPFAGVGLPAQWASGAITIEVANFSAQSIIGNPNITPFTNYVYVVNPIVGNTYNWSVTNGGIITGQGTNTVTVMWGQNGPYQISLTESNGICSDESTLFVVNNNCSISVAAVSADGNAFCPGTIAAIQAVTGATGITYQWYLNGSILNGETNADLQIETGGNYQVMITQGSCTAISQTLAITELPAVIIPDLQLSQSNPGCSGGSAIISAVGGSFNSYQWSNGATSPSIEVTISGDYTVELSDNNGCVATAGPVSVNFALQDVVPICLVTVDPTTGSNLIVWEPVTSEVTSTYVIYKETNVADVYAVIGTVDYGSDGMFEDVNSNSAVQASRYKLALIDTCDIESSLSDLHKTIHLTSNLGVGNTVNLIWSHYEGFAFGSYNIYRGTASDNMTLIATIASNLNSYTDLLPLTNGYYMIEVEGVSCDPSRTLQTSTSNIINYQVEGIDEIENSSLKVYPNPAYDRVTLQCDATLIGNTYVIFDVTGREIIQGKVVGITTDIAIEQLSRGEYILKIGNDRVKIAKL